MDIGPVAPSTYRGTDVYACGPWSQGPVVPMTLNILECVDMAHLAPDHPMFFHLCAEALKLTFADREAYFGDPRFADVPLEGLLAKGYGRIRHGEITDRAHSALPRAGDPWAVSGSSGTSAIPPPLLLRPGPQGRDTAHVAAMDVAGNAFSATPSHSGLSGPLVPGLGIIVSSRGSQLRLDPAHPACIAPGKRPRLTPNPALLMRNGRAVMAFGCPGGDAQPKAMVQVVARMIDFGLNTQQAIERPRLVSLAAPDSFHPHGTQPGVLLAESRIGSSIDDLVDRGHLVRELPAFSRLMGAVCAVGTVGATLEAGADPRRDCMAAAW